MKAPSPGLPVENSPAQIGDLPTVSGMTTADDALRPTAAAPTPAVATPSIPRIPPLLGHAGVAAASTWAVLQLALGALLTQADLSRGSLPLGVGAVSSLTWLTQVLAWALTGAWLTQALAVVRARRGYEQQPLAMAWVGWFLPVLQLTTPYDVMSDATKPLGRDRYGLLAGGGAPGWPPGCSSSPPSCAVPAVTVTPGCSPCSPG